ncbi:MAG: hypothetical protein WD467_03130 [Candidatus Saccharimonadales bacterium]
MIDPGTFQIPNQSQPRPEAATAASLENDYAAALSIEDVKRGIGAAEIYANQASVGPMQAARAEAKPEASTTSETIQLINNIGECGDWVAYQREQYLQSVNPVRGVWQWLGGVPTDLPSLMRQEAKLSSQLFADRRSTLFLYDRAGAGHAEWVLQVAAQSPNQLPTTVYYEVNSGANAAEVRLLAKWPESEHRHATAEEVVRLNLAAAAYYKLVTSRIYNSTN